MKLARVWCQTEEPRQHFTICPRSLDMRLGELRLIRADFQSCITMIVVMTATLPDCHYRFALAQYEQAILH